MKNNCITNCLTTWVELNKNALWHNIDTLSYAMGPAIKLGLVVKANAYGHGLKEIVELSSSHPTTAYFFTASLAEAIEVKQTGCKQPVCALVPGDRENLEQALNKDVECSCFDQTIAQQIVAMAHALGKQARVHLKVDTGLSRLGFTLGDIPWCADFFKKNSQFIKIVGVMSHLADVVQNEIPYAFEQRKTFDLFCSQLRASGLSWEETHLCSSGACPLSPDDTLVRVGTTLYGYWKSPAQKQRLEQRAQKKLVLMPVLSWKTRIMHLKTIPANTFVGYGQSFVTQRSTTLAILPIGYSDGLPRDLSNKGFVAIRSQQAPILGKVSMNATTVDVSDIPNVVIGSEVVLLGPSPSPTADNLAELCGTVHIDILSRIQSTLPRRIVF